MKVVYTIEIAEEYDKDMIDNILSNERYDWEKKGKDPDDTDNIHIIGWTSRIIEP